MSAEIPEIPQRRLSTEQFEALLTAICQGAVYSWVEFLGIDPDELTAALSGEGVTTLSGSKKGEEFAAQAADSRTVFYTADFALAMLNKDQEPSEESRWAALETLDRFGELALWRETMESMEAEERELNDEEEGAR